MPFLGQDWRSPGEQWVRTSEGWERLELCRLKLFGNLNENVLSRLLKLTADEELVLDKEMRVTSIQPRILVTRRVSREKKIQISLAEALTRLDMCGAAKDLGRFNYVAKLLEILIRTKLLSLSGTAQKVIFNILEEVVSQVIRTKTYANVARGLLQEVKVGLERGMYDHVGSSTLWGRHLTLVNRLQNTLNDMHGTERPEDGGLRMSDLPDDCLRQILLCLDNHRDLVSTGLTEVRTLSLAHEDAFWKKLCLYHFSPALWRSVTRKGERFEELGWKTLHSRLAKRYGLRENFAEMLHLCNHCNTLFWENHGHHCLIPEREASSEPVSPAMCVQLFTS